MWEADRETAARIIALRETGKTYAEIGQEIDLGVSRVVRVIYDTRPDLTVDCRRIRNKERDLEICRLRGQGLFYEDIAKQMGVSVQAVQNAVYAYAPYLKGWVFHPGRKCDQEREDN